MRRLVLLDSAVGDFASILEYITHQSGSRATARRFVDRLVGQCRKMASLPGTLGRPRPELLADIRSFPFQGYIIFFRHVVETLEIVNVLEGHRDIDAHFHDPST